MTGAVLSFGVEFLGPVILADPFRPNRAEWPPAPARVYAALVAAACEHRLGDDVLSALQTLEGSAPAMTASNASALPPHQLAVPTAHTFRGLALMPEPEVFPRSPVVTYHWPLPESAVNPVSRAVRCLSHLGRAESLVLGDVHPAEQAPSPNWVPDAAGEWMFRVPARGRFQMLERDYRRGRCTAQLDPPQPYRRVDAARPVAQCSSPWTELIALRTPALDIRSSAQLAQGLRRAVLSVLGDAAHPQIHGHVTQNHVAWLALPHVMGDRGDGSVLGVGALLPAGLDAEASRQLRLALAGLREIPFGARRIPVRLPDKPLAAFQFNCWAQPSRFWATATPLVLEHKVGADASRAVAQAIVRAGYPRPVRVQAGVVPCLKGAVHAAEYIPRRDNGLPRRHALAEFAEPLRGPLLAGGERYSGLGLFRPVFPAPTGSN